ncbi:MAG TPA: carboxypeptidase-like regulatory domain-containing protein [Chitinophagaceae bacterium]
MKNKTFILRILIIFIASAVFISCSKEKLYLGKSNETVSAAKMFPVYNYGGISGTLSPAPYYAALKVYNDEGNFGTSCFADVDGNFKITGLYPGNHHIMVVYIPNFPGNPPVGEYRYFEIPRITVEPGMVTELGVIPLPK